MEKTEQKITTYNFGQADVEEALLRFAWHKCGMDFDARMEKKGVDFDIVWDKDKDEKPILPVKIIVKK